MNFSNFFFLEGREIGSYAIENIFFAPLKIMTNQKSPANFWARFSGHGLLVMKSSAKDADPLLRLI
jgi:hypothetical protein